MAKDRNPGEEPSAKPDKATDRKPKKSQTEAEFMATPQIQRVRHNSPWLIAVGVVVILALIAVALIGEL